MQTQYTQTRPVRRPGATQWLLVAALGILAGGLVVELARGDSNSEPERDSGKAERSGQVFAMTSPVGEKSYGVMLADTREGSLFAVGGEIAKGQYGVFLIDAERGKMALYGWSPKERKLRWLATRNFTYDLKLDDYNTEIKPRQVRNLVERSEPLGDSDRRP